MDLSRELNSQDWLEMAVGRVLYSCHLWESCFALLGASRDAFHTTALFEKDDVQSPYTSLCIRNYIF